MISTSIHNFTESVVYLINLIIGEIMNPMRSPNNGMREKPLCGPSSRTQLSTFARKIA
ncbi:hypothetical protein DsansV1_C03g0025001 [Dioscorea sansibarensis]